MYQRAILHFDLDSFFVSVECLKNSAFIGKPLLIGGIGQRGVVASCSYEARRFGVHSAMPIKMALRLCPDAIVLRGDMDSYMQHSQIVTEIIAEASPLYEKASIDEFYIDISGMDKYFGCFKWSQEMRTKIIKESGLPISSALAINKLVSKIGTNEAKPNGEKQIITGTEKSFLAPLRIDKIPGVGEKTYKKLSFMGVQTIKTLSELPPYLLQREFGQHGKKLWESANAIDYSPVVPYHEQKSISKEQTFMEDSLDIILMRHILQSMADDLCFDLRQNTKLCSVVTVKIRYKDFNTYTKQKKVHYTAGENIVGQIAQQLFDDLYTRRQMIRLIGLKLSGLVHGKQQYDLFYESQQDIQLSRSKDAIREKFGHKALIRASSLQ